MVVELVFLTVASDFSNSAIPYTSLVAYIYQNLPHKKKILFQHLVIYLLVHRLQKIQQVPMFMFWKPFSNEDSTLPKNGIFIFIR